MNIDPRIAPTNPYHIGRAYAQPAPASPARDLPPDVAARIGAATDQPDTAEITKALIAAQVPGKVDFAASSPAPVPQAGAPLQMYRRPWDKNEAAVAVQVGRAIDISG